VADQAWWNRGLQAVNQGFGGLLVDRSKRRSWQVAAAVRRDHDPGLRLEKALTERLEF